MSILFIFFFLGYISVLLPTEAQNCCPYPEINLFDQFSSNFHWSLNSSLSTIHLMAIISLANTLLSLREASVVPNTKRGLIRLAIHLFLIYIVLFSLFIIFKQEEGMIIYNANKKKDKK